MIIYWPLLIKVQIGHCVYILIQIFVQTQTDRTRTNEGETTLQASNKLSKVSINNNKTTEENDSLFKCEWIFIVTQKQQKNEWIAKSPCVGKFCGVLLLSLLLFGSRSVFLSFRLFQAVCHFKCWLFWSLCMCCRQKFWSYFERWKCHRKSLEMINIFMFAWFFYCWQLSFIFFFWTPVYRIGGKLKSIKTHMGILSLINDSAMFKSHSIVVGTFHRLIVNLTICMAFIITMIVHFSFIVYYMQSQALIYKCWH